MPKVMSYLIQLYNSASRESRIMIRSSLTLPVSTIIALTNAGLAIHYRSIWMLVLSGYYLILLLARGYVIQHQRRRYKQSAQASLLSFQQERRFIFIGAWLLVALGIAFAGISAVMYKSGYPRHYGTVASYVVALMGFVKLIGAIVGLIQSWRLHSGGLGLLKSYSLADGMVGIVTTQYALLALEHFKNVAAVTGGFGLVLANLFIIIGLLNIIRLYRKDHQCQF